MIHFTFNKEVVVASKSSLVLTLTKNNDQKISQEIKIDRVDPEAFEIVIKPLLEPLGLDLESAIITVSESNPYTIHIKDRPDQPFTGFPMAISGVNYYNDGGFSDSLANFTRTAMYVLSLIVLIMMILSIAMALSMIKLLQLIYFLLFLDLKLPRNAAIYLNGFRKTLLDYLPMPVKLNRGEPQQRALTCQIHRIFKINKLDCVGINNYGGFVIQFGGLILAKLLIMLLIRVRDSKEKGGCCKKRSPFEQARRRRISMNRFANSNDTISRTLGLPRATLWLPHHDLIHARPKIMKEDKTLLGKVNRFLNLGYFYNFLKAVEMKVLMGALISLKHVDSRSPVGKVDVVFSTLLPVFFFGMEFSVVVAYLNQLQQKSPMTKKDNNEKKKKNKKKKTGEAGKRQQEEEALEAEDIKERKKIDYLKSYGILSEYSTHLVLGPADVLIRNVNDLVFPLILVFLTTNPTLQLILLSVLTTLSLASAMALRPFKTFHLNFLDIVNKIFYLLILGILGFSELKGDRFSNKERFKTIGVAIIATIFVMLAINFTTVVIVTLRNLFCKPREKGEAELEVRKVPKAFARYVKKEILNEFSDDDSGSEASSLSEDIFGGRPARAKKRKKRVKFERSQREESHLEGLKNLGKGRQPPDEPSKENSLVKSRIIKGPKKSKPTSESCLEFNLEASIAKNNKKRRRNKLKNSSRMRNKNSPNRRKIVFPIKKPTGRRAPVAHHLIKFHKNGQNHKKSKNRHQIKSKRKRREINQIINHDKLQAKKRVKRDKSESDNRKIMETPEKKFFDRSELILDQEEELDKKGPQESFCRSIFIKSFNIDSDLDSNLKEKKFKPIAITKVTKWNRKR